MKLLTCAALALTLTTLPALAEDARVVSERLATLIAAEPVCDITLDADAMLASMTAKIDAADLDFNDILSANLWLAEAKAQKLTGVQKTLHCAQVRRNAEHYGWLKAE